MRKAQVFVNDIFAGILEELDNNKFCFTYEKDYNGAPVSLTIPVANRQYEYNRFPPFFEGLLPEGELLEALLRKYKLDKKDYFGQLLRVGQDVVGAVTVEGLE